MLKTRVITAVIALVAVGIVLFAIPRLYAEVVIGLLMVAGAWEWSAFLDTESNAQRFLYTGLVSAALAGAWFGIADHADKVLLTACAWWVLAFFWNLRFPTPIPTPIRWICGFLVVVPLFVALILLLRQGVEYLIFTLLIVWVADGGAYFAGKAFGRVKLAPAISPKKTWEGVVGGFVLVAVLATATAIWRDIGLAVLVPFCLAVGAISIVGDLTVSMFKRTTGVKDSGTLFPGHGGVLDRVDSVAAAAPLFVLGMNWLGLA
ncbi:MAG: phosphatidate cytidylyltransferase [Woeseiaceae bacterium]|nr:phosphatidate cytidylyltransferase [Woeseiaceae bacterium]